MKKLYFFSILTFLSSNTVLIKAQSIGEIDKKIDSISTVIEFHQQEINKLNLQLAQLTNAKTEIQASKSNGIILYCN